MWMRSWIEFVWQLNKEKTFYKRRYFTRIVLCNRNTCFFVLRTHFFIGIVACSSYYYY